MKSEQVIKGFFWRLLERFGAYIVSFIVSIILARMLTPEEYGTVALVAVITNILQVFVDSGMGFALIQKKDADDMDFSSVFFFNIVVSFILYGGIYTLAPIIASFYNNLELVPIMRVLGLTLIISGLKNVQQAYVSRNMLFKRFFYATLIGTFVSAIVGIVLAYTGAGVWALVAQSLTNTLIDTCVLWLVVDWKPKKNNFSFNRLKLLWSYGWKLLVSSLVGTISNNLRQLLIGIVYTPSDLAYYNRGDQIPSIVIGNINSSIDSVIFPAMSEVQDSPSSIKNMVRRAITVSTYIMAPVFIGLACCAEPLVALLLTEKWLPCVPYLRIFCFTYMFYPIHTANLNAINALGRSDINLKLELIKKIVEIGILLLTVYQGIMVMVYSLIFISVFSQVINTWPNRVLLEYGYFEQMKDIVPEIVLASFMGGVVFFLSNLPISDFAVLCLQIVVGVTIYIVGSAIFKLETYEYLKARFKIIKKR